MSAWQRTPSPHLKRSLTVWPAERSARARSSKTSFGPPGRSSQDVWVAPRRVTTARQMRGAAGFSGTGSGPGKGAGDEPGDAGLLWSMGSSMISSSACAAAGRGAMTIAAISAARRARLAVNTLSAVLESGRSEGRIREVALELDVVEDEIGLVMGAG